MELNEKLAEWAGLQVHTINTPTGKPEMWWCSNCDYMNIGWLDFTQSLDACYEWFKVSHMKVWTNADCNGNIINSSAIIITENGDFYTGNEEGNKPAMALCKAIEKLINETSNTK